MLDISVIICTHDPKPEYLTRVLEGLRCQTLARDKWELLVIDNASKVPLAPVWDISWHPKARHILENELGLGPARRRGMGEALADLLVFVDDDNVLNENYLSEVLRISRDWPVLGVWGSGSIFPEFEVQPPEHLRNSDILTYLGISNLPAPCWANIPSCHDAIPAGAGMCVRASVAAAYRQFCAQSLIQITGRRGTTLSGGEDVEICFVACKEGLGIGVFPDLKLTHLMPKERVSEEYLIRLVEGSTTSGLLLKYKWYAAVPRSPFSARGLLSILRSIILDRRIERRAHFARVRASIKIRRLITPPCSG